MIDSMHERNAARIAEVVRRNAGSAGLAAALMIYFGFFVGYTRPTGTDWFTIGNLVFFYTVRVGGVAMAGIAIGSMAGLPIALAVDAFVSIAIGVLLGLSAVVMLLDGGAGFSNLLYVVFGIMFISAGVRNGTVFLSVTRLGSRSSRAGVRDLGWPPPATPELQFTQPDGSNLAGRLRQRLDKTNDGEGSSLDASTDAPVESGTDDPEAEDHDEWLTTSDAMEESNQSPFEDSESAGRDPDELGPDDSGGFLVSFSDPKGP